MVRFYSYRILWNYSCTRNVLLQRSDSVVDAPNSLRVSAYEWMFLNIIINAKFYIRIVFCWEFWIFFGYFQCIHVLFYQNICARYRRSRIRTPTMQMCLFFTYVQWESVQKNVNFEFHILSHSHFCIFLCKK